MTGLRALVAAVLVAGTPILIGGAGAGLQHRARTGRQDLTPAKVTISPTSPQLRQIRVQPVATSGVGVDEVFAPGRIVVDPRRTNRVALPVPGRVARVMVQMGDAVARNQPLLAIESPEAEAAVAECRQAQAAVTQASAAVRRARADLDRVRDLFEHKAVARKDVLHAEEDLAQAEGSLEQAHASQAQARRRLEILGLDPGAPGQHVIVRSAVAGKVMDVAVAAGEYRTGTDEPVMTVADLTTVLVTSDVPERDIRLITPGEHVAVELVAYPGETFTGRVTRIADAVDARTRTVQVQAEIANRGGRLRPEMYGRIRHSHAARALPVVPVQAIVQGARGPSVFVEEAPGVFDRRRVVPGQTAGGQVSILQGLTPGDRVVVDGAVLLAGRVDEDGR